jgi:hypothetical protein
MRRSRFTTSLEDETMLACFKDTRTRGRLDSRLRDRVESASALVLGRPAVEEETSLVGGV